MKRLVVWMITLSTLFAGALDAQDVAGNWQGSIRAGDRELRLDFQIDMDGNKLKAVMYSIDRGGQPISASAVTRQSSTIKMTVATANYEGKLSSDGKSIVGTWNQGSPLPLNLARVTPETAWTIPEAAPAAAAMPANADPTFEVATIKPSEFADGVRLELPGGRLSTKGTSVSDLIKFAYDLHPRQIVGGPAWLDNDKWDVTGKPDTPGMPSLNQVKAMVRKLLADRFQLSFHHDRRELPVYAIAVAKSGAKMTKNDGAPDGRPAFRVGPRSLSVNNATVAEFASILQSSILERPTVDQTGLASRRYDFTLTWTPDSAQPQAALPPDAPPDLFTAFQQQLGLKLEATKASVDVIVIDRMAKPSEN